MSDLSLRSRDAAERCPYCHDELLADEALAKGAAEVARCDACQTVHHQACLEELGRCTVLGCGEAAAPASPAAAGGARSAIRERIRSRVQSFVRENVRAPAGLDLERMHRTKAFEVEVQAWLPEFLSEALRNSALYSDEQRRVIERVAARRGLR